MKANPTKNSTQPLVAKRPVSAWLFPVLIVALWGGLFYYTFNPKLDLNGDNCAYYIYTSAMATGHGYADLSVPNTPPTNNFPPGYPLLMLPIRLFTDSIIAQKIWNGLFLLGGLLLLYFALLRLSVRRELAFVTVASGVVCARVLHFATMMMSEMSFFLTSAVVVYSLIRLQAKQKKPLQKKPFYKNGWFYLMLIALLLNYHIRTQGMALIAAVLLYFLVQGKWKELLATIGGCGIGCLPWILRNKLLGLSGNRYLDSMLAANNWRPEDGQITFGDLIVRFFTTLRMLIFQAIPNSVAPFLTVDYQSAPTVGNYIIGTILLLLIIYGFWQLRDIRWLLLGYWAATMGLIALMSSPSENRYLTSVLPILSIGLFVGIYALIHFCLQKSHWKYGFTPLLLLPLLLTATSDIQQLHANNSLPYPPAYKNYFKAGEILKQKTPKNAIVCSRKSAMFYLFSERQGVNYKYTTDTEELIRQLEADNVDYVILDGLGYSSTYLYLYPAIQAHQELFVPVYYLQNPDTYILRFVPNHE